jgi:hypothetical protein
MRPGRCMITARPAPVWRIVRVPLAPDIMREEVQ